MLAKSIIRALLLVIAIGSVLVWAGREFGKSQAYSSAAEKPPAAERIPAVEGPQVVMTYFLIGKRCKSCRIIENLTRLTAERDFAAELASGKLVFRVIDTGQPANRHYLKDYQLATKTVVISRRVGGHETGWKDMPKVWDLLDDEATFRAYLGGQIREYLGR
jgi:hypothetical protein